MAVKDTSIFPAYIMVFDSRAAAQHPVETSLQRIYIFVCGAVEVVLPVWKKTGRLWICEKSINGSSQHIPILLRALLSSDIVFTGGSYILGHWGVTSERWAFSGWIFLIQVHACVTDCCFLFSGQIVCKMIDERADFWFYGTVMFEYNIPIFDNVNMFGNGWSYLFVSRLPLWTCEIFQ